MEEQSHQIISLHVCFDLRFERRLICIVWGHGRRRVMGDGLPDCTGGGLCAGNPYTSLRYELNPKLEFKGCFPQALQQTPTSAFALLIANHIPFRPENLSTVKSSQMRSCINKKIVV